MQAQIVHELRRWGWLVHHSRPAVVNRETGKVATPLQGDPGLPDLVAVRGGRVIFVECKTNRGKVTPEQQRWIEALGSGSTQQEVWIVRPSNLQAFYQATIQPDSPPLPGLHGS